MSHLGCIFKDSGIFYEFHTSRNLVKNGGRSLMIGHTGSRFAMVRRPQANSLCYKVDPKYSIQSGWKNNRKWGCGQHHSFVEYRYRKSQDAAHRAYRLGVHFSVQSGWKNNRKRMHWLHGSLMGCPNRWIQKILRGHTSRVKSLAFSPDGKTLVSGSEDGSVLLWKMNP